MSEKGRKAVFFTPITELENRTSKGEKKGEKERARKKGVKKKKAMVHS